MTTPPGEINIEQSVLTPAIGVEIKGVNLSADISDKMVGMIHALLMNHLVVFLRNQAIEPERQVDFARRLGPLRLAQRAAFELVDGLPEIALIVNDKQRPPNVNHYHTDGIFRL